MMDTTELKKAAEAATVGVWRYGPGDGEDENPVVFVDLPQASGVAISILFESDWATDADAKFVSLAQPSVVLALIAEKDRYFKLLDRMVDQCLPVEEMKEFPGFSRVLTAETLKAERDTLIAAMNEILRVTPMGVEAFGIAALVMGELGVSGEAGHDQV